MKIIDKDMRREVAALCKRYGLTLKRAKKGYKLITRDGRCIGCVHQTPSDRRAYENFKHEVEARLW